ncbi:DMT family transporter [Salibacterium sp. K-3]
MADKKKAYFAAIILAFIIGLTFMFVKTALMVASPMDVLAHRFTIALVGVIFFIRLKKIKLKVNWRDLSSILPLAVFYPLLFFSLQVFGLARTSSLEAGVIHATVPIFTLMLAGLMLKERATLRQIAFISLSVVGVFET